MSFAGKRLFFRRARSWSASRDCARAISSSRPARAPPFPAAIGASQVPYFTNETIFDELKEKPESLIVIGGGPIGCELGQMFSRLGVKVTILQRGKRLLDKEDPAVSEFVRATLEAEGVRVLTEAEIEDAQASRRRRFSALSAERKSPARRSSSRPGASLTWKISTSRKPMSPLQKRA